VSDVLLLGFAGFGIPPRDPFEMVGASEADDFRVSEQADGAATFSPGTPSTPTLAGACCATCCASAA